LAKARPVLITRPHDASDRLASELKAIIPDLNIVQSPLIEIVYQSTILEFGDFEAIIVTSQNALKSLGNTINSLKGKATYCVGTQTAKIAQSYGLNVVTKEHQVEDLISHLATLKPQTRLLYLRGKYVTTDLKNHLKQCGLIVVEKLVYEQNPKTLSTQAIELLNSEDCLIPLYSIRTAKILTQECNKRSFRNNTIFCISQSISDAFTLNWKKVIADPPTEMSFPHQIAKISLDLSQ